MKLTFTKLFQQGDFIEVNGIRCTVIVCAKDRALVASPRASMPFWVEFKYLPTEVPAGDGGCYED